MFVTGSPSAVQFLLNMSSRVTAGLRTSDGPWAHPRMDGRYRVRPLGGLMGNGSGYLTGYGNQLSSFLLDEPTVPLEQIYNDINYNFPPAPPPPSPGDVNVFTDQFFLDSPGQVLQTVVSDIKADDTQMTATLTPILCQEVFPSIEVVVLQFRDACD